MLLNKYDRKIMCPVCLCVYSVNSCLRSADVSVTDGNQKGRMEHNHVKSSKSMDLGKTIIPCFSHHSH